MDVITIPPSPWYIAMVSIATVMLYLISSKIRNRRTHHYPPGPPGEPVLGHLRVVPFDNATKAYTEWAKEYSEPLTLDSMRVAMEAS